MASSGRHPRDKPRERIAWFLALAFFVLGAVWLASSFDLEADFASGDAATDGDSDAAASADGDVTDADGTTSVDGATQTRSDRFTVSVSGDILIHERVAEAATTATGFDFAPLFAPVQNLIASRDFAICHLEVPISSTNTDLAYTQGVFRAPTELAAAIKGAGFDSCSVASNHSWDSGEASVISTIAQLNAVQLPHVGIANTSEEAVKSWQFDVLGNTVGHLSYTYGLNGREPDEVPANRVARIDEQTILADAARQRLLGSEFTIVSLHWGTEFQNEPNEQQADLGPRLLASPDIDLIVGHHAHVPQSVEEIDGEYIAYGLGNLLSNQAQAIPECPEQCPLDSQDGVLLDFVIERNADGDLAVTDVVANPTWVDVGGTWKIISTDRPPEDVVNLDVSVLRASGERTRASLGLS
jgi:poly-gamma-glutamate capsule biosynthesis protein CapA/YwtB (metallophosphatase superfamily)